MEEAKPVLGERLSMEPDRRFPSRKLRAEMFLMLAGLAVVWFALVGAAAYVMGPAQLCEATLPAQVCWLALGQLPQR